MTDGRELVGWGVATGMWEAMFMKTTASAKLSANGHLEIASAASDIGTGTYTVMTQVAADTLGLQVDQITAHLGDSDLPTSPLEGGSWGAASVGAAVQGACLAVGNKLLQAAGRIDNNPLDGAGSDAVAFEDGRIVLKTNPSVRVSFGEAMRAGALIRSRSRRPQALG